jgi:transcriptional regulator with XRE-family HTH domain
VQRLKKRKLIKTHMPKLPVDFVLRGDDFDSLTGALTDQYIERILGSMNVRKYNRQGQNYRHVSGEPTAQEALDKVKAEYSQYLDSIIPKLHANDRRLMLFGTDELKLLREKHKITLRDISVITGIPLKTLAKYSEGELSIPFPYQMLLYYLYFEQPKRITFWLNFAGRMSKYHKRLHTHYWNRKNYIPPHLDPKLVNAIFDKAASLHPDLFAKIVSQSQHIPKTLIPSILKKYFINVKHNKIKLRKPIY